MIKEVEFGTLDYSNKKLIKFTLKKGEPNLEDIVEYFDALNELLDTTTDPFMILFDATKSKWASGDVRISYGKKGKEFEEKYGERFKKNYFVIPNTVIKMILKGVNLVAKPKVTQVILSTLEEAEEAIAKEMESW